MVAKVFLCGCFFPKTFPTLAKYFVVPYISVCPQVRYLSSAHRPNPSIQQTRLTAGIMILARYILCFFASGIPRILIQKSTEPSQVRFGHTTLTVFFSVIRKCAKTGRCLRLHGAWSQKSVLSTHPLNMVTKSGFRCLQQCG